MKIHFLGIGGSGASAAAAIAQAQGYQVTGCDLEPHNEFTSQFKKSQLFKGHNPKHLKNIDILAATPAIYSLDPNNPELVAAKEKNIPVMSWQQFTGRYLTKGKFVIAVAGTHGKTTTTAMIAKLLEDALLDPTVELGTIVPKWGTNYRVSGQTTSDRKYFVIEADEYNDNFLAFTPDISVVTNIEMDHPEYFKDFEAVKDSFRKFLGQTKGTIVANLSDPAVAEVIRRVMRREDHHNSSDREVMTQYLDYSKNHLDLELKIPGSYNQLNAAAAMQVGLLLGIDSQTIKFSLQNYTGIGRRFEYLGEFSGAKIYSDFGHHPTEIKVTMQAAREKFPSQRIILIYEPHMFSRTKALFDDFVKVFREIPVDKVIITDIYPSREVDTGLVASKQLADAVGYDTLVYHSKEQLLPMLKHHIKHGDIVFFMGAGDIDKIAREFVSYN